VNANREPLGAARLPPEGERAPWERPGGARTFAELVQSKAGSDATFAIAPGHGETLTYADLARRTAELDAAFASWGIAPGEIVGFMLPNGLAALQLFVATMAAGRIVLPFNLIAQDAQLDYVLGHAAPRIVFATAELATRLASAIPRARVGTRIETCQVDALALPAGESRAKVSCRADDPALLMYTSGTTGVPKGVLLTHANMLYAGRAVAAHQELSPTDRVLSSLPLYHINGQCIATVSTLVSGGSVVLPQRFSTSQWWSVVERYRPTWLNLVPTIVAYLLNGPDLTPAQREAASGVRYARSASAPLPPDQQRAFEQRFGIPIVEAMGLTESASVAFCNPMDPRERRIGSAGRPLGVQARVVDGQGRELKAGEQGEIQLKGPNVMRGYYRAPRATDDALAHQGWLATGDLGYRDADEFYFITGRLKELIIKGGENIAPREIDEALLRHPGVLEAAAVGVPDREYGQQILACIVRKPGAVLEDAELEAHCLRELGRYKTPRYFRFVDELPKGPSGKVQRMKLADAWRG
jgi:acyl-CoA synthetase (AMP-forming)/AMP-acid ligase II